MANKAKKDNKNLIIGICAAVVVVVVIIVAVVLATSGTKLNDAFFVSDGSKYVVTMEADESTDSDDEVSPVKVHLVYFYSDDKVTDMKSYYEFADDSAAKKAYDLYKEADSDESEDVSKYEISGKYVILTADASQYEGMTANDAKQQVEFTEMLKNMDSSNSSGSDTVTVEETETEDEK